ncbi:MAG: D-alanyl-D-alanine carboxypeptidase [Firmicutes bacterium]|nr:D-alanyl-D-alanine carboxypeptidase [Bacillota bacterium]
MRRRIYRAHERYDSRRRDARWPLVLVVCALLCLCIGVGGSVFHVWDRVFPPQAIQASAKAASVQSMSEAQNHLRQSLRTEEPVVDDIVSRLLTLLDTQLQENTSAEGIVIMDEDGQLLFSQNIDMERTPASMTKLLTAIVVLEAGALDDMVMVDDLYGCFEEGSVLMWLEEYEQIAMKDLLAALMVMSANDAAAAVALHMAGSMEGFAAMMNEKAQEMGLTHSNFVNPHGLTVEGHYSSPGDMVQILKRAAEYDILRELATMDVYKFTSIDPYGDVKEYELKSNNGFATGAYSVDSFTYICGKTGYTKAAGQCLAAAFESEDTGKMYYCVVMKSEAHFDDMSQTVSYLGERLESVG